MILEPIQTHWLGGNSPLEGIRSPFPNGRVSGSSPRDALAALLDGKAHSGMWDGRAATTPGGVLTVPNISGGAASFVQATAANQPAVDPVTGLHFDGTNDEVRYNSTVATGVPFTMLVLINILGTNGRINRDDIFFAEGSGLSALISGGGTLSVEGAPASTRGQLYTALAGPAQIFKATGYDLGNPFAFGRDLGSGGQYRIRGWVLLRESEFASNLAEAVTAGEAWLESMK